MNCEEIRELLPLYSEKMLDESDMKAVREHLKNCTECKEELKILDNIKNELGILDEIEPSAEFNEKLKNRLLALNAEKKKGFLNRHWKEIFTAAASAAVIAISVVALSTDFYKMESDGILSGKASKTEEINNSAVQPAATEAPLEALSFADMKEDKAEKKVKKETEKPILPEESEEKKTAVHVNEGEQAASAVTAEEGTPENDVILKNSKEESAEIQATQGIAAMVDEKAEVTGIAEDTASTENDAETEAQKASETFNDKSETTAAAGGGGGSSSGGAASGASSGGGGAMPKMARLAPRYDKITFNLQINSNDESYKEILSGFENENGEYKLPIEVFYEITNELLKISGINGYYTSEDFTEEYNKLAESDEDDDRISEIEEICKFGYIVIELNN